MGAAGLRLPAHRLSRWHRIALFLSVWIVYGVILSWDMQNGASALAALILIPIVLGAWWMDRIGLALSLLGLAAVHSFFFTQPDSLLHEVPGLIVGVAVAAAVGWAVLRFRAMHDKMRVRSLMLDSISEAVVVTDLKGRVTDWNRAATRLYGWPAEEALGRPVAELLSSPIFRERAPEIMEQLRRGATWDGESVVRRRDGTSFPAWVADAPIHDENGDLVGIICVSRDLSVEKRRAAQERLVRDREKEMRRLIELSRYKTDFLNNAAHELLTPLTPVDLQLELLLEGKHGPLTDRQRQVLTTVDRNIKGLERILADIVDVAQAQKAPVLLRSERVDLATEAATTSAHYQGLAEKANVAFSIHAPNPVVVEGDPVSLHRIFSALIDNALRFSNEGGHVWIDVSMTEELAMVRIADDGTGIDAADATRIFEPFGHARIQDPRQGSGLGLYMARQLVELHRGSLDFQPRQGGGSVFTFRMPVSWKRAEERLANLAVAR